MFHEIMYVDALTPMGETINGQRKETLVNKNETLENKELMILKQDKTKKTNKQKQDGRTKVSE